MKPVLVFRYARSEGPGHFATFLAEHGIEWRLVALDAGDPVAPSAEPFAGLGFMGGPMSANDELAWTQPVLALMRDAVARGVPVIGHCLGGQMLARALGARVTRHDHKEIGWVPVEVERSAAALAWFGDIRTFDAFEWHEDTFAVPAHAERVLSGKYCANQAYVVDGLHLGMQCHVEMTAEMIETWCRNGIEEIDENIGRSPAVQDAVTIRRLMLQKLAPLTAAASRLYGKWIEGLKR